MSLSSPVPPAGVGLSPPRGASYILEMLIGSTERKAVKRSLLNAKKSAVTGEYGVREGASAIEVGRFLDHFFQEAVSLPSIFGADHEAFNARGMERASTPGIPLRTGDAVVFFSEGELAISTKERVPDGEDGDAPQKFEFLRTSTFNRFEGSAIVYSLADRHNGIPEHVHKFLRPNWLTKIPELILTSIELGYDQFRPSWFSERVGGSPQVFASFSLTVTRHKLAFSAMELDSDTPLESVLTALQQTVSALGLHPNLLNEVQGA